MRGANDSDDGDENVLDDMDVSGQDAPAGDQGAITLSQTTVVTLESSADAPQEDIHSQETDITPCVVSLAEIKVVHHNGH